ncbi:hypothetical protein Ae168Ps1_2540 [Pseudonocardia sp. Ae168_Ps1]|nr:hypothetical protein Ae168Ps1_2540 [Pseudonocardia sp. Ae168_Ps1]
MARLLSLVAVLRRASFSMTPGIRAPGWLPISATVAPDPEVGRVVPCTLVAGRPRGGCRDVHRARHRGATWSRTVMTFRDRAPRGTRTGPTEVERRA